uniref:PCI domain-containing protein n=1 Tax=Meloidogyne floridensis TaxID=298350 RepID=A0A915NID5_9BILA
MRPNYQSHKPEAALQRAHEFISYVELCVNLRNSTLAKDGLYQYKILTQQVAVKSLETVLETFLTLAEQKTLEAQKSSIEKIEEIDDLDVADAPENLLLSFVSGAVPQDRMDRTVLSPWLRFQWDTFRNCLDLLRNNVYVEQIYHHIARQSFAFCLQYQRRNEFRKLSDMLRIKLTNIESLTLMLETRLCQLDTAINMELWQEAYKSAEDLHNLMQIGKDKDKKIAKPSSYVNYYDKIALVFWKGGNTLFHAASLLQKFNIYKDMKKQFTGEEATDQATRVLLATLSIPDGAENPSILTKHLDIEEQHVANTRILSALLRMPIIPTRNGILKEIARLNIPEIAAPEAFKLYKCIENDFDPLHIAVNVQEMLLEIEQLGEKLGYSEYGQYSNSIKQTVAAKIVKQISSIYESITLERLSEIIPFFNRMQLEQFLVDICKQHSVSAHIDHRQNCIYFGPEDAILASELESENGNISEISKIKTHVSSVYSILQDVHLDIDQSSVNELQGKLARQIKIYLTHKDGDFERILARRKKIEHYKESTEQMKQEKLLQVQMLANKQEEKRRTEEYKKLMEENKENEQRRKLAEQAEIQRKVAADRMQKQKSHPLYEMLVKELGEEAVEKMDLEQFIIEKRNLLDKERKEQQNRMLQQEKKFDYNVRAVGRNVKYKKLMEENKENEQRRKLAEQEEIKRRVVAERMQKQKSHPLYEMLVKELGEEAVEKMDLEQFIIEKRNLLDKERKEQQNRMLQQEKKFDYNVRAVHLEEMLVWKELSDERQASAPALFDQYETRRIDEEIKAREKSLETFQLLTKVKDDAIKFMRSTIQSHAEELKVSKEQWKEKMESVREKAIEKLANERMKKWQVEVERQKRLEEEQRRKEEQPPPQQVRKVEAIPQQRQPLEKPLTQQHQESRPQQRQELRPQQRQDRKEPSPQTLQWRDQVQKPPSQQRGQPNLPPPQQQGQPQQQQQIDGKEPPKAGKYLPPHVRKSQQAQQQ